MMNVLSIPFHWKSSSKRLIPSNIRLLTTVCGLAMVCSPVLADDTAENESFPLEVVGITVTPHQKLEGIEFDYEDEPQVGGRVQLFIRNTAPADSKKAEDTVNVHVLRFDNNEPKRNVFNKAWSWEDTPAEWPENDTSIPPGALTVFSFNSMYPKWIEPDNTFQLEFTDWINSRKNSLTVTIPQQQVRLSSICFLSTGVDPLRPDSLVFYLENLSQKNWKISSVRIYQPYLSSSFRMLKEIASLSASGDKETRQVSTFPFNGILQPGQKIAAIAKTPNHLKLTTAVVEIALVNPERVYETTSVWEQLRVRRESFDIGGGWIAADAHGTNVMTKEPWLKTLKSLHINTANIQEIPGYTDQTGKGGLYQRYPIKWMGTMQPLPQYDNDANLNNIHAAESLGNVQDEINNCSPQDAMELLRVYGGFRIPTSLILTNPWQWNQYAGVSDYPHFNVARLAVPNAFERWDLYPRWEKKPISWAAPLETMGILTRNLRENSRPVSISAWIQGPFDSWTAQGERKRLAPTPNELRALAWQALSARITSLHWFNLNISSLVKYRDLITPIQKINREARLLEVFFLYGDSWKQVTTQTLDDKNSKLDWSLSSIICPRGALLCALDLDYEISSINKTFKFRHPRETVFKFNLPNFLSPPYDVFRIDADGIYDVSYQVTKNSVEITDKQSLAAVYVATRDKKLRKELENRRQFLINLENFYKFDPANNRKDFDILKEIAQQTDKIIVEEPAAEEDNEGSEKNSGSIE
ncbi:MAG: hypothetical protein J5672_01030 [Verrucomicrobia bacterium]|nr:hypothetical protein [Verrucomicrobiota bacterium]